MYHGNRLVLKDLESKGVVDLLEKLVNHPNQEIAKKAIETLNTYWKEETESNTNDG